MLRVVERVRANALSKCEAWHDVEITSESVSRTVRELGYFSKIHQTWVLQMMRTGTYTPHHLPMSHIASVLVPYCSAPEMFHMDHGQRHWESRVTFDFVDF